MNGFYTLAPSVPAGIMASAACATLVNLAWQASTDDVGLSKYTVHHDVAVLAIISGSTLSYSDYSAYPSTTYSYSVDAFNAEGNHLHLTNERRHKSLYFDVSVNSKFFIVDV